MKMNKAGLLSLVLFLFGSLSCSGRLDRQEYVKWVRDYENGLHVKKESGDFVFDVQFTPADYRWLQNINQGSGEENQERVQQEELQYYTLTVSLQGAEGDLTEYRVQDNAEKQRKLYYFSYLFQDDIYLEENGEELPCVLYHFEKSVDLKHGRTFVLGFENPHKESGELRLVINSEHFSSLPIRIKVLKDNIPALKI